MSSYINALKKSTVDIQSLFQVATAMDNLAPLAEWRGNSNEEISGTFVALAEVSNVVASTLLGDLGERSRVDDHVFLAVLAESVATLTNFYRAAMRDAMNATNPECIEQRFGNSKDIDDTWHVTAHKAMCEAVAVFPQLVSHIESVEFRARREYRAKENYRESALKAEKRVEEVMKENQKLRRLIREKIISM